jgi:hypothetical protein
MAWIANEGQNLRRPLPRKESRTKQLQQSEERRPRETEQPDENKQVTG